MRARIYQPAKTAMSSGTANTRFWVLEYAPDSAREVDPLMGWTSSNDMQSQVTLQFESKDAALEYANDHNINADVIEPKKRKVNIRQRGYGENFATDRRTVWTH
ncbi:ETC complex I subunit [Rhodobacteraceae bacterium]|jgi:NADH dehydrogenase|nr:ETC complex I subunit [Marinovum sp.]MDA8740448.1 ETC complex I subunit [Paracoccaceae bacterium]MDG2230891.1 ETC complex I subunit [Paracoccaceae bacterium]RZO40986.1 MAG: ETC complex I subunit [Paracoccaceae bacterium]|tara:strand:+ start:3075 stop:3386 length:312 start_codon:yes stop_codon:yes gene_type:complete